MIKLSFTLRVLFISFVVLALPLLIDSFIFFQTSYIDSIQNARSKLKELANFRRFTFEEIQPVKQVLLKELIYFLDLPVKLDGPPEALDKSLAVLAHRMKDFQIFILKKISDTDYEVVASSAAEFYKTTFRSYLIMKEIVSRGEGIFLRDVYSPAANTFVPFLFIARVVRSLKGETYILTVATEMSSEFQTLLRRTDESQNVNFAILNHDGVVLDSTVPLLKGQYFDPLTVERKKEIVTTKLLGTTTLAEEPVIVIKGTDYPFFEFIFNNQVQIAYRSYVSDVGISLLAFSSKQEYFGRSIAHFLIIYSIYGVILIVGGGVTYWISLWISRPLRKLTHLMKEVSVGNLGVRFKKEPLGFEINLLGQMFNNTLEILLENVQRAEDEKVKKELYEKELDIGRQVQKNLLSKSVPKIEGADVAGTYLTVREAGGDFYGLYVRETKAGEKALFFGVTDAAGKGIPASLFAMSFRSLMLSYAQIYDDVGDALSKTNNAFIEDVGESGMFVKALHGVFYPKTKVLYYYSCGNIPGIVRKADGHLFSLEHSGMAIGLKESTRYRPDKVELNSGDFVLFFTDGLIQAMNEKHQFFSERMLKNLLQSRNWQSAQEMIDGIVYAINEFTAAVPREEEITLVVLRVT